MQSSSRPLILPDPAVLRTTDRGRAPGKGTLFLYSIIFEAALSNSIQSFVHAEGYFA